MRFSSNFNIYNSVGVSARKFARKVFINFYLAFCKYDDDADDDKDHDDDYEVEPVERGCDLYDDYDDDGGKWYDDYDYDYDEMR